MRIIIIWVVYAIVMPTMPYSVYLSVSLSIYSKMHSYTKASKSRSKRRQSIPISCPFKIDRPTRDTLGTLQGIIHKWIGTQSVHFLYSFRHSSDVQLLIYTVVYTYIYRGNSHLLKVIRKPFLMNYRYIIKLVIKTDFPKMGTRDKGKPATPDQRNL
jgi:hypothetical protein